MINPRPYADRTARDTRAALVALALGIMLIGLLILAAVAVMSPSLLTRGQDLISGTFSVAQQADYSASTDRPVAPQRPVR